MSRLPRTATLVLILASCGSSLTATTAPAGPDRWHKHVVTYRDVSYYPGSVRKAVDWINEAGAGVRLKRARKGRRADITIVTTDNPHSKFNGVATVTTIAGTDRVARVRVELNRAYLSLSWRTSDSRADTVTHELLHALGV